MDEFKDEVKDEVMDKVDEEVKAGQTATVEEERTVEDSAIKTGINKTNTKSGALDPEEGSKKNPQNNGKGAKIDDGNETKVIEDEDVNK